MAQELAEEWTQQEWFPLLPPVAYLCPQEDGDTLARVPLDTPL